MGLNKFILGLTVLFVGFISCKKDKEEPVDFKYEYCPNTIGHFCIYDVTEIFHDEDVGVHDTVYYQLKEKIESSFVDDQGRPSLRIERYKKDTSGNWVIADVWHSTRTTTRYEKVEEDERFIRLAFPVKEGVTWNGNVYTQRPEWINEITDVDVARSYGGFNFPNTTRVLHVDEFNFVQKQLSFEVFAKNIGLVSKYYKELVIDGFDSTNAQTGKELYMNIISYGVE